MKLFIIISIIGALTWRPLKAQNKDTVPCRTFHLKKIHADPPLQKKNTTLVTSGNMNIKGTMSTSCYLTIAGYDSGSIPVTVLQSSTEVYIEGCNDNASVASFDLIIVHQGASIQKHSNNSTFTADMTSLIDQLSSGDRIIVQSAMYKTAAWKLRAIKGLTLKINGSVPITNDKQISL